MTSKAIHNALEHHQAGRLPQAEAIYRQILKAEPNNPDALHLLGVVAYHKGEKEVAVELIGKAIRIKPSSMMHCNLGLALHAQGQFGAAVESYKRALLIKPGIAEVHNNLGNTLQAQGELSGAIKNFRRALSIKPNFPEAHVNLGSLLLARSELDEAVAHYRKALVLRPDYVEAHQKLGVVFRDMGRFDAAVECFKKALALKPDDAETHTNLGNILHAQGKQDAAIESYRRAISLKPESIGAYNGLALTYLSKGDATKAFEACKRSFIVKETEETKALIVWCINNVCFVRDDVESRDFIARAFTESWGRPSQLVSAGISLIKLNRDIKACIDRAVSAWPTRLSWQELFGVSGLDAVVGDRLLQCLLENAPVCDFELERFLTMARLALLDAASESATPGVAEEKALAYYCALAQQCFITEYIFAYSGEELERARLLSERLVAAVASGTPFPALWLVAVAAYFPLYSLFSTKSLLDQPWPEAVTALLVQQVREPMLERQLRADIPSLTAVEGEVSRLVRQQYEENPYPRWIRSPHITQSATVDAFLRERYPYAPFKPIGKKEELDILIAGCGTGQQPIQTAQQFHGARVLAVDLSLSSLSYAKRKTQELGLSNIEYAQADIMKLGVIDRTFDIIESVGVLHHLANPMAGWKELVSLLRPGGLMYLGFYSELARQGVVAAREFVAAQGYSANAENIRKCRQELFDMKDDTRFKKLTSASDFYTASECRDLIFHVQEHRYRLPQLKANLAELGLDFIGFILQPDIIRRYGERFPDDSTKTNLDYWNIFEIENTDMFTGMYQFYAQKRGL